MRRMLTVEEAEKKVDEAYAREYAAVEERQRAERDLERAKEYERARVFVANATMKDEYSWMRAKVPLPHLAKGDRVFVEPTDDSEFWMITRVDGAQFEAAFTLFEMDAAQAPTTPAHS